MDYGDGDKVMTSLVKIIGLLTSILCIHGCQGVKDVSREYAQIYSFIDSASIVKEFVRTSTIVEWPNPTVEVFDTALYSVANHDLSRFFAMKIRTSPKTDSIMWANARQEVVSAVEANASMPVPLPPDHPVVDSSHFVVFMSPDIYGLIVAELLPVYPQCYPRCNPRKYGSIATFTHGLRMSFYFDERGRMDSVASYVVQR
jgi:hypothetical protein